MLSYKEYEQILRRGKRVDWYGIDVPEKLVAPGVKAVAEQIIEQINIYKGVDSDKKNNYIETLWANIKDLPYKLNGDCYLLKKKEIEEKIDIEGKTKPKKEKISTTEIKKVTKNSSLIFGNKTKTKVI